MVDPANYQLFVYGSLRSGFQSPAYEYISRYFQFIGPAQVRGRLYDMGNYPAGVPVTGNEFIKGELYKIRDPLEFDWAIGQLDDYEGVATEDDEVQLYKRETCEVYLGDRIEKAWIYWYKGTTVGKPVIKSGDVIEYIKNR